MRKKNASAAENTALGKSISPLGDSTNALFAHLNEVRETLD